MTGNPNPAQHNLPPKAKERLFDRKLEKPPDAPILSMLLRLFAGNLANDIATRPAGDKNVPKDRIAQGVLEAISNRYGRGDREFEVDTQHEIAKGVAGGLTGDMDRGVIMANLLDGFQAFNEHAVQAVDTVNNARDGKVGRTMVWMLRDTYAQAALAARATDPQGNPVGAGTDKASQQAGASAVLHALYGEEEPTTESGRKTAERLSKFYAKTFNDAEFAGKLDVRMGNEFFDENRTERALGREAIGKARVWLSAEGRADRRQEKQNKQYESYKANVLPQIQAGVEAGVDDLAGEKPEIYVKARLESLNARIGDLDSKDRLSHKQKRLQGRLEIERGVFAGVDMSDPVAVGELYLDSRVKETREKYAKEMATRKHNTLTVWGRTGSKRRVEKAHMQYMIARGVQADSKGAAGLDYLFGEPGKDGDYGEEGRLVQSIALQGKLQSGIYRENTDAAGNVTAERIQEKQKIMERAGSTWRKWGTEGRRGFAKKALVGAVAGTVSVGFGLGLGLLGASVAAAATAAGVVNRTVKVLKTAGVAQIEKHAQYSIADEDARTDLDEIRRYRGVVQEGEDENRLTFDSLQRVHERSKRHKRTVALMGSAALVGVAPDVASDVLGYVGRGVSSAWQGVFGDGNAHALMDVRPAGTGDVRPPGNGRVPGSSDVGSGSGDDVRQPSHHPESAPDKVVTPTETNGRFIEQVYRAEGLKAGDYTRHATDAIKDGDLLKVKQDTGTFYYKVTPHAMRELGLSGDATSTENVIKVLANHSGGAIKVG